MTLWCKRKELQYDNRIIKSIYYQLIINVIRSKR